MVEEDSSFNGCFYAVNLHGLCWPIAAAVVGGERRLEEEENDRTGKREEPPRREKGRCHSMDAGGCGGEEKRHGRYGGEEMAWPKEKQVIGGLGEKRTAMRATRRRRVASSAKRGQRLEEEREWSQLGGEELDMVGGARSEGAPGGERSATWRSETVAWRKREEHDVARRRSETAWPPREESTLLGREGCAGEETRGVAWSRGDVGEEKRGVACGRERSATWRKGT